MVSNGKRCAYQDYALIFVCLGTCGQLTESIANKPNRIESFCSEPRHIEPTGPCCPVNARGHEGTHKALKCHRKVVGEVETSIGDGPRLRNKSGVVERPPLNSMLGISQLCLNDDSRGPFKASNVATECEPDAYLQQKSDLAPHKPSAMCMKAGDLGVSHGS